MRRKEVSAAICSLLESSVPAVKWVERLSGAGRGKDVCGSVTCDRVEYRWEDKSDLIATAIYSIYLVDAASGGVVDDLADDVFEAIHADDLGGVVLDSNVERVVYGGAQGKPDVGIVMMEYKVEYYEEW